MLEASSCVTEVAPHKVARQEVVRLLEPPAARRRRQAAPLRLDSHYGGYTRREKAWSASCSSSSSSNSNSTGSSRSVVVGEEEGRKRWEDFTVGCVKVSTLPFMLLLLPQIIRNGANMAAGRLSALIILSWTGYLTSLMGNAILLSYFVGKRESGAAIIQAIGVVSNFIMLGQIYLAGYLHASAFWGTAVFAVAACLINAAYVMDSLDTMVWSLWENFLGILGLGVLVQVFWTTLAPIQSIFPGILAGSMALILAVMDHNGCLSNDLKGFWSNLSAWTATSLFGFQPIGQLVKNFTDPSSLEGLSIGTIVLAMTGNGLMVPRALKTRDKIWLTGSLWGSLMMGWAQLLSMYLGVSTAGVSYLHPAAFFFATFVVIIYFGAVFKIDAVNAGLKTPLSSLAQTYGWQS